MIDDIFAEGRLCRWRLPDGTTTAPAVGQRDIEDALRDVEVCERQRTEVELKTGDNPEQWRRYGFGWLPWLGAKMSVCTIGADPVATGPMSGCWIATWLEAGERKVMHVGTNSGTAVENSTVKAAAADTVPDGAVGFNPHHTFNYEAIKEMDQRALLMAFVLRNGECWAVLLLPHTLVQVEVRPQHRPPPPPPPEPTPPTRRPNLGRRIFAAARRPFKRSSQQNKYEIEDDPDTLPTQTVVGTWRCAAVEQCPGYSTAQLRQELRMNRAV